MKFSITNIGSIGNATIDINGITIIAGENNVGKSTIGKALFAYLRNMSSWEQTYARKSGISIREFLYESSIWLEDFCMKNSGAKRRRTSKSNQLISQFSADENFRVALEDYQVSVEEGICNSNFNVLEGYFIQYATDYFSLYFKQKNTELLKKYHDDICSWAQKVTKTTRTLDIDEVELQKKDIIEALNTVFGNQYRKIGTVKSSIYFSDDNDREVSLEINENDSELSAPLRLNNNIYFIESPKIYDYLSSSKFGNAQRKYLQAMMSPNVFRMKLYPVLGLNEQVSTPVDANDDLRNITEHLVEIMGGRAEFRQKVGLEFKDKNLPELIHSVNVSTGLKSMALLEYALRIGAIEYGDIVILDEPEINLHPEWQIEYAKALVDLQKYFGLKFIITTHSPFFIRAIECYSDINDVMENLNVYRVLIDESTNERNIYNVSYSEYGLPDLYEDLSAPLDKLDRLLDDKYGNGDTE